MSTYSVYIHTNKVNGKRYIGVTRQKPERRWQNGEGYKHCKHFYSAIKKYGWDNFDHFVLEVGSEELMFQLEKQYIAYYKTTDRRYGYNTSLGGEDGGYLGKDSWTKEYRKQYNDSHRKEHKDYYEEHKKRIIKRVKDNYEKHREEKIQYLKEYRQKNREELKKKQREFWNKHKDELNYKRRMNRKKDIQPITPLW